MNAEDAQRQYYEEQVNAIIADWPVEDKQRFSSDWNDDSFIEAVNETIKDHSCSECNKNFSTPPNLKSHIRRVHSLEIPHTCDRCHKGFASVDMLKRHSQVHQKEKIHGCSKCGKRLAKHGQIFRTCARS